MLAYVMDANSSVNVDTELDLRVLKLVMEDRKP
jgi:CMP-N-acetylneuraminic acid synthetase